MKKVNSRKLILMIADIIIIMVSGIVINFALSVTKIIGPEMNSMLIYNIVIDVITCVLMLFVTGSYSVLWRYFNIRDYLVCGVAGASGFVLGHLILVLFSLETGKEPRKIFTILFCIVAVSGMLLFRLAFKKTFLILTKAENVEIQERTMIVGAGMAGRMILAEIKNARYDKSNPSSELEPVCFIDDDTTKLRSKIMGVEVVGTTPEIPRLCKKA